MQCPTHYILACTVYKCPMVVACLQELGVWCEALQAPKTHGFGPQAASMLAIYQQLKVVLESVEVVRQMHAGITSSAPPLQVC